MGLLCGRAEYKKRVTSGSGGTLRDIYPVLLQCHHLLPDEVGRQNPWVLFRMLDAMEEDSGEDIDEYTNEHLRMFYGKEV